MGIMMQRIRGAMRILVDILRIQFWCGNVSLPLKEADSFIKARIFEGKEKDLGGSTARSFFSPGIVKISRGDKRKGLWLLMDQKGGKMRYRIAECITEYEPVYEMLKRKMAPYSYNGNGKTEICLSVTDEFCRKKQREQSHLTVAQCEYVFAGFEFYRKFILHGGMMLHASAVMVDGAAYLFSADSGTGKSTHTKLWQECLGKDKALIINDDKPAIRKTDKGWFAYGTPFSGKTDENLNKKARIQGICMLERGSQNKIGRIEPGDAISLLMKQTVIPRNAEMADQVLIYLDALLKDIPIYRMECTISEEAAKMSYEAMRGEIK